MRIEEIEKKKDNAAKQQLIEERNIPSNELIKMEEFNTVVDEVKEVKFKSANKAEKDLSNVIPLTTEEKQNEFQQKTATASKKDIAILRGIHATVNQATSDITFRDGNNVELFTVNIGFANNEGTTFKYNEVTNSLELWNDQDEMLSAIPVDSFVSNHIASAVFNPLQLSELQFKDQTGTVKFKVTFTADNIAGMQNYLKKDGSVAMTGNLKTPAINITEINDDTFGIVSNKSALYHIGGSYSYGISIINQGGGIDIMANQLGQPIRFWSGGTPESPILTATYRGKNIAFFGDIVTTGTYSTENQIPSLLREWQSGSSKLFQGPGGNNDEYMRVIRNAQMNYSLRWCGDITVESLKGSGSTVQGAMVITNSKGQLIRGKVDWQWSENDDTTLDVFMNSEDLNFNPTPFSKFDFANIVNDAWINGNMTPDQKARFLQKLGVNPSGAIQPTFHRISGGIVEISPEFFNSYLIDQSMITADKTIRLKKGNIHGQVVDIIAPDSVLAPQKTLTVVADNPEFAFRRTNQTTVQGFSLEAGKGARLIWDDDQKYYLLYNFYYTI